MSSDGEAGSNLCFIKSSLNTILIFFSLLEIGSMTKLTFARNSDCCGGIISVVDVLFAAFCFLFRRLDFVWVVDGNVCFQVYGSCFHLFWHCEWRMLLCTFIEVNYLLLLILYSRLLYFFVSCRILFLCIVVLSFRSEMAGE